MSNKALGWIESHLIRAGEAPGHTAHLGSQVVCPAQCSRTLLPTSNCAVFLRQCPVRCLQDVVKGLFVCCVFLDYVSLSQRFIPELINFLLGILYIATPNKQNQGELI